MTQAPDQGGASVRAHGKVPSVDLSFLLSCLVKALPKKAKEGHITSKPALFYDSPNQRLVLNTYAVLRRLVALPEFLERFRHTDSSGLLRDVLFPPRYQAARLGGRLFENDLRGVSDSIAALKTALTAEFDTSGVAPQNLLVLDAQNALRRLARETGATDVTHDLLARIIPVEFTRATGRSSTREKDVARVICAEEEVQAEDWLERMARTVVEAQARRDDEFDDIQQDKLRETLRQDSRKNDSQVNRFLNFLEDEALARVRLMVSFAVMRALAAQANGQRAPERAFVEYVERVLTLFDLYGTPEAEDALELDMTRDYGLLASFQVSSELVKAGFYYCLPVWAEWSTQLYESRHVDPRSDGISVVREVSYRFRVNGRDPMHEHLHAFDSRLLRHRHVLLDAGDVQSEYQIRRALSETVFLWLVLNPDLAGNDLRTAADALMQRLRVEGKSALEQILGELSGWSEHVQRLSRTLVDLLRSKTRNVITHAQKAADELYVVVQEGVVDWQAIERSRGRVRDPLVKPTEGIAQNVEWFKHIKIVSRPESVPDNLFSMRVRTVLRDRTLSSRERSAEELRTRRALAQTLLNVIWMPIRFDDRSPALNPEPRANIDSVWRMGPGIDVWYEPELLKRRRRTDRPEEDQHQYRAATAAALTILVHIFLQMITEKCSAERQERLIALMLRFQTQGREADASEGDSLIYAAAQAVESALMREIPIRMQGMVTEEKNLRYRKRGAVVALNSALPLVVEVKSAPVAPRIAAIIYATRPCDDHPGIPDADGFLFQARTYLAEAVSEPFPGYRLSFDRMQSHVVETRDEFRSPKLVVEEVSRLHGLGFDHIILLSHHFGNRRLNRSAQRHSPHTQTAFLDEIASKFSTVCLYMLRRDVFPATRLHKRENHESAFEVFRISEHEEFAHGPREGLLKQLVPVYTLATLAIVGNDDVGRPQSGFCTYFLDTDYQVRNIEWRERIRSNLIGTNVAVRDCLLAVLRGLHFLEAEKAPHAGLFQPVLDPFGWVAPASNGAAGEIEVFPASRRKGPVLLSLPALLSHVTDALHRGRR